MITLKLKLWTLPERLTEIIQSNVNCYELCDKSVFWASPKYLYGQQLSENF